MRRTLTKIVAVIVQVLLIVNSIGFVCLAYEFEDAAELKETMVMAEPEQPEGNNEDSDGGTQPSDQSSDAEKAPEDSESPDGSDSPDDTQTIDFVDSTDEVTVGASDAGVVPADPDNAAKTVVDEVRKYYFRTIEVDDVNPIANNPDYVPSGNFVNADSGIYRYQMIGNEKIAYEKTRNYIIDVANGRRVSTTFTIKFADLELGNHHSFTAEELGVNSIIVDGQISDEAANAMIKMASINMQDIVYKVLVDLPFDCYWFDKTAVVKADNYSIGATSYGNSVTLHYVGDGITFRFPVVSAYEGGAEYNVSTGGVNRAMIASANALEIVNRYSNLSDYGKLMKYREEICGLVDYNYSAVEDKDTPYGDPWNPVYVFDGNDDTNVVCEGYSKAYKYLCDLSDFENDVTCITVAGNFKTSYGTNNGHMWNIVSLGNGMNYMVDLTNCDNGSIGYYDRLMFKKYSANPDPKTYRYTISSVTIQYTYYNHMVGIFCDAALDLSDGEFVNATAIYISGTSTGIDLNWNVVSGADHYEVYRRTESDYWEHIGSATNTYYQDKDVSEGKYYYGIVGMTAENKPINVYNDKYSIDYNC